MAERSPTGKVPRPDADVAARFAAVLAGLDGLDPTAPRPAAEAQSAARNLAERTLRDMGTGIDPGIVLEAAGAYVRALQGDPWCAKAYEGIGRVALALARIRPGDAEAVLDHGVSVLGAAITRLPTAQDSTEMHELEARLREERRKVRERPRAQGAEPDIVRLQRDREGRAIENRPPTKRFRPSTGEILTHTEPLLFGDQRPPLRARVQAYLADPTPERWTDVRTAFVLAGLGLLAPGAALASTGAAWFAAAGLLAGAGAALLLTPWLARAGRRTRGMAPVLLVALLLLAATAAAFGVGRLIDRRNREALFAPRLAQLAERVLAAAPAGPVAAPPGLPPLQGVLVVADDAGALSVDPLHERLPLDVAAADPVQVQVVAVVRREAAGTRATAWVYDVAAGRTQAAAVHEGATDEDVDLRVRSWLLGLGGGLPRSE